MFGSVCISFLFLVPSVGDLNNYSMLQCITKLYRGSVQLLISFNIKNINKNFLMKQHNGIWGLQIMSKGPDNGALYNL
jgi:hypothetical protein